MNGAKNLLLEALSAHDKAALEPHLKPVYLDHQKVLCDANGEIETIYFPTGSIVSLVVTLSTGETIEAAMVGKDGAVGASAAFDGNISPFEAIVQLAGPSMACSAKALKTVAMDSRDLLSMLARHEQTVYAQAGQSAACIASHNVENRLCRWLLRARDLADSDTLQFTQEYIAEMLGVRRTSVTMVARTLQQAGMIKYARGKIQIIDLEALQDTACECYPTVKTYYAAMLGDILPAAS